MVHFTSSTHLNAELYVERPGVPEEITVVIAGTVYFPAEDVDLDQAMVDGKPFELTASEVEDAKGKLAQYAREDRNEDPRYDGVDDNG